jgi:hypothetical protein
MIELWPVVVSDFYHRPVTMGKDPKPFQPCVHNWTPIYDDDDNIIGRVCTKCGTKEGG